MSTWNLPGAIAFTHPSLQHAQYHQSDVGAGLDRYSQTQLAYERKRIGCSQTEAPTGIHIVRYVHIGMTKTEAMTSTGIINNGNGTYANAAEAFNVSHTRHTAMGDYAAYTNSNIIYKDSFG